MIRLFVLFGLSLILFDFAHVRIRFVFVIYIYLETPGIIFRRAAALLWLKAWGR